MEIHLLAKIKRLSDIKGGEIYLKLEGNNPAGSVKDRPAFFMINEAELSGKIKPGDTLIEATSGNTGIALAMVAAMRGYKMVLIMPENQSIERRQTMKAFGAEISPYLSGRKYGVSKGYGTWHAKKRNGYCFRSVW